MRYRERKRERKRNGEWQILFPAVQKRMNEAVEKAITECKRKKKERKKGKQKHYSLLLGALRPT